MKIRIIKNKINKNVIMETKGNKKIDVNIKMKENLNVCSRLFVLKEEKRWNQRVKKNLIDLKIVLFLRDCGLLK